MTAAVAPTASALSKISASAARTLIGDGEQRRPRLVPVPNCEPPFDDEIGAADRGRTAHWMHDSPITAVHSAPRATAPLLPPTHPMPGQRSPLIEAQQPVVAMPRPGRPPTHHSREPSTHPPKVARRDRPAALGGKPAGSGAVLAPPRINHPTIITSKGVPPWSSEADIGVRRTTSEHLPAADRAARVLARALVEILSGQRPVAQLRVHCAPEIYAGLLERPFTGQQALPHILTVRVCEPADGVAEVSAAFRRADRVRAVAFRIEGVDGRWRITALQVG